MPALHVHGKRPRFYVREHSKNTAKPRVGGLRGRAGRFSEDLGAFEGTGRQDLETCSTPVNACGLSHLALFGGLAQRNVDWFDAIGSHLRSRAESQALH
jgi:hypothetical protein